MKIKLELILAITLLVLSGLGLSYALLSLQPTPSAYPQSPISYLPSGRTQTAAVGGVGSGLIAHYTFDEGSGISANDTSGAGNIGALTNGPTWTMGKVGSGALLFDGVDDKVVVPVSAAWPAVSVSLWIKVLSFPGGDKRIMDGRGLVLRDAASGGSSGKFELVTSTFLDGGSISNGVWHQLVATADSGGQKIYIDGVLSASNQIPYAGSTVSGSINIGGGLDPINAIMDDFRIYNRALPVSDVSLLYDLSTKDALITSLGAYYIRPGGTGSGTSWSDAWGDLGSIDWSDIGPGKTICIAGGTYSQTLAIGASGSSGQPITIKRARAGDGQCGSSVSGWNSSYDSQVVLNTGTDGIVFATASAGSYVTIDGQVDNGIKILVVNATANPVGYNTGIRMSVPASYVTLRYLEVAGPDSPGNIVSSNDNRCLTTITSQPFTGLLVSHVRLHGCANLIYLAKAVSSTIEQSVFYDAIATPPLHSNVLITFDTTEITFRYNNIYNWNTEGILMCPTNGGCQNTAGVWHIYGNIFHDGASRGLNAQGFYGTDRVLEIQYVAQGPIYFYNNTIVNTWGGVMPGNFRSGSKFRNNIYWNIYGMHANADKLSTANDTANELSDLTFTGCKNCTITTANPFVSENPSASSAGQNDYHLTSSSRAKDVGTNLGSPYNNDHDGIARPQGSAWDIGAYEYTGTAVASSPNIDTTIPAPTQTAPTPTQYIPVIQPPPTSPGTVSPGGGGGGGGTTGVSNSRISPITAAATPVAAIPTTLLALPYGTKSSDVVMLQNYLIKYEYLSTGLNTGFYGPLTQAAVSRYRSAALSPSRGAINTQFPLFTRSLKLGETSAEVKNLQIFLNAHGFTISLSGPGSYGFETTYYGPATTRAVSRYQTANRISPPAGYFGPITRAMVNGLIAPGGQ